MRKIDEAVLGDLRVPRAQARAIAWAAHDGLDEVILDVDAGLGARGWISAMGLGTDVRDVSRI